MSSDATPPTAPTDDEIILAMLRDVLRRRPQWDVPGALVDRAEMEEPGETGASDVPAAPAEPGDPDAPVARDEVAAASPVAGPPRATTVRSREVLEAERLERLAAAETGGAGLVRPLRRLIGGVLVAAVLFNVPLAGGLPLARALPDQRALVVRDGLLLKGSDPQVYVLEDNQRRWISSLDAFEHFGYSWDQVHVVGDEFLARFPDGRPLHVLLKCADSPHVYRLEGEHKRWIRDIATFTAEGHQWQDVRYTPCRLIASWPDGPPIPPDAGTPEPDASNTVPYPTP